MEKAVSEEHRDPDKPGRRDYDTLVNDLEAHIVETDRRLRKFFIGALLVIAVIGLSTAISIAGFGIVLHDRANVAAKIQEQREESINRDCVLTNQRHDRTVTKLLTAAYLGKSKLTPSEWNKLKTVIDIVDAAVPYENCTDRVNRSVREVK